jgi:hypothetical protein
MDQKPALLSHGQFTKTKQTVLFLSFMTATNVMDKYRENIQLHSASDQGCGLTKWVQRLKFPDFHVHFKLL